MALDLLRDPVVDRRAHEGAHLAALRWLGYSADILKLDLKHGDFGFFGGCDGVRRTTGDPEREARDRSTIAALGPLLAGRGPRAPLGRHRPPAAST